MREVRSAEVTSVSAMSKGPQSAVTIKRGELFRDTIWIEGQYPLGTKFNVIITDENEAHSD